MAERTMEELLQAPTEGYGEAIVIPKINADHFEIKTNLLQLVQVNPFHDTFYNDLNENDQDSLNAVAGGNLLSKTTREALNLIENKLKVRYSRNKSNVSRMNMNSREGFSKMDERIDKLADQISTLVEIVTKKVVTPATVKAVEESCVTCGGAHAYYNCPNTDSNQSSVCAATGTYNQVAPPNRVSNHMAPPGFALGMDGLAEDVLSVGKFTLLLPNLLLLFLKRLIAVPLNLPGRSLLAGPHGRALFLDVYGEDYYPQGCMKYDR
ncbi:hypothetical protein Tco_0978620 [Tanacetum coccineum]|uniref:Reverse transcriptase domain-containing protein n=1 Tax=Tanacetum coccineum TaxID=301880 RepID=A0ABQ5ENW9_9ASTR